MNPTTRIRAVISVALLSVFLPLEAEFLVFSESFSFEGELNGRTPAVASAGVGTWTAGADHLANGSVLLIPQANRSASIGGMAFESGRVYELSTEVAFPTSNTGFFGIGFLSEPGLVSTLFTNTAYNNLVPAWMLLRANGEVIVRLAGGSAPNLYASGTGVFPSTAGPHTLKLAVDTRPEQWQLSAWVNSTQLNLNESDPLSLVYTWTTNPEISLVGFTANSTIPAGSTADNFQLYSIPEPAAWALFFGCAAALMAARKRFSPSPSVRP